MLLCIQDTRAEHGRSGKWQPGFCLRNIQDHVHLAVLQIVRVDLNVSRPDRHRPRLCDPREVKHEADMGAVWRKGVRLSRCARGIAEGQGSEPCENAATR
jgi:hypothetical protein